MAKNNILRLHWKLYFPLVGLLWVIIGITILYFVGHERQRLNYNLESRLTNVNNTVIEAYKRGEDLQATTDFISMFVGHTTLSPIRITVYDDSGLIVADNEASTISIYDSMGELIPPLQKLWAVKGDTIVRTLLYDDERCMISSKASPEGGIHTFAALPYEGAVTDFLKIDPMIWVVVIILGVLSSGLAFLGVRAVSQSVYTLRDFARMISSDKIPEDVESLHFSNDELGDVSRDLLTLYRDKIHAEDEKVIHERQIGMNISHELKTPVGIIKGYIDSVLENDMPEELKRSFLERAQQNADRLAALINDLSMVMRLQDKDATIECRPVNLNEVVGQIADDITHESLTGKIGFTYTLPPDCYVSAQDTLLTNALLNLIRNAAQHSGGDVVSLRFIREEEGMYLFNFSDNGCGVGEEHLDRLFDLFYRVDKGRSRKNGGTGLGLPIVQKIIKSFGGSIKAENEYGGGLRFVISLKVANKGE